MQSDSSQGILDHVDLVDLSDLSDPLDLTDLSATVVHIYLSMDLLDISPVVFFVSLRRVHVRTCLRPFLFFIFSVDETAKKINTRLKGLKTVRMVIWLQEYVHHPCRVVHCYDRPLLFRCLTFRRLSMPPGAERRASSAIYSSCCGRQPTTGGDRRHNSMSNAKCR